MWGTRSIRRCGNRRTTRRGAAVVETAVVTPLILTMVFGVIEFGWVFMIQQSLTNSVREACRAATLPGATDVDITNRFIDAMEGTGITVTSDMVSIEHATEVDPIVTVRASMPSRDGGLSRAIPGTEKRRGEPRNRLLAPRKR